MYCTTDSVHKDIDICVTNMSYCNMLHCVSILAFMYYQELSCLDFKYLLSKIFQGGAKQSQGGQMFPPAPLKETLI